MTIADDTEQALAELSARLTAPIPTECLFHYLCRMLDEFGCRGHHFTAAWAEGRALRGRPVLQWATDTGGCCCDCEVILNSFRRPASRRKNLVCARGMAELDELHRADDWWSPLPE